MTPATLSPPVLATVADALRLLQPGRVIALDVETTGLDPLRDRVRLLSLSDGNAGGRVVLDCWQHDVAPVLEAIRAVTLVCHNGAFDLSFLYQMGLVDLPRCVCTYLLSQLLDGTNQVKGHHGLAGCCKRYLDVELSKELQGSDWSGPLSPAQIEYAGRDAAVLIPLVRAMGRKITAEGLDRVADVELRCLPAWVWLRMSGVAFDRPAWEALAAKAAAEVAYWSGELDRLAPPREAADLFGQTGAWNWASPQQVIQVLKGLGLPTRVQHHEDQWSRETSSDVLLAEIDHPFAENLRKHRGAAQRVKMYGENWLAGAAIHGGRLYPGWRQMGTDTGRTSCSSPNCQQVPRDTDEKTGKAPYRQCFVAQPGKVIVKADYAGLQMRIACKLAKDLSLWRLFSSGGDAHTDTAKALFGEETKTARQVAKSANFLLIFGGSAEALRLYCRTTYGLKLTPEEAKRHHAKFFQAREGLARWHAQVKALHAPETRSTLGRRRRMYEGMPDTDRLNTPAQADEADGAKTALGLLWERRATHPSARPVLFNHDEIVLECDADQGEAVKDWLVETMTEAMAPILDPVPCRVDGKVAATWGG